MMYQLVLQWSASSIDDYDTMILVEESLIEGLSNEAEVDGHDGGSGEVNIFILAHDPPKLFEHIKTILRDCGAWSDVRIAYRHVEGNDYTILWPKNLRTFEVR